MNAGSLPLISCAVARNKSEAMKQVTFVMKDGKVYKQAGKFDFEY